LILSLFLFNEKNQNLNMTEVRYSIKDLENFTQIKAHTIRIWEQRYKLLAPQRTDTNIRYYSEDDLKKILNINLLYNNGLKISKIAALQETEIIDRARQIIQESENNYQSELDELIVAILDFDKVEIRRIFNTVFIDLGMLPMYTNVISPLLHKIGELWQVNSLDIIHEHFFSNLYRSFLLSKIDNLEDTSSGEKSALLFLHDDEEHEFSLLLYHYLLKKAGYECFYLGQNLPVKDLSIANERVRPDLIATTFIKQITEKDFSMVVNILSKFTGDAVVVISGWQAQRYKEQIPENIKLVTNAEELAEIIG